MKKISGQGGKPISEAKIHLKRESEKQETTYFGVF